jgi:hypothetical protein
MNDSTFSHAVVWLFSSNSSFVKYLTGVTSFIALLIVCLLYLYKRWGDNFEF